MNRDRIQGNWKQLKGWLRANWGQLTDDHLAASAGRCEISAGRLQKAYGIGKDGAARLAGGWRSPSGEVANDRDSALHRIAIRR
jgi:uncharacterized protein YjbJ (UPF0337 family)